MELPFIMVAAIGVGGVIGHFLDNWLHTKPYLMLLLGSSVFSQDCATCCAVPQSNSAMVNFVANAPFQQSESRISSLTLLLGVLVAIPVAYFYGWRWGMGIVVGAVLAWFNFRWLRQGLDALTQSAIAQGDQKKARVPVGTYFKALFRYGLIALDCVCYF